MAAKLYLRWPEPDERHHPMSEMLLEVDAAGTVLREIGLDDCDRVVYRYPFDGYPASFRGFWEMAPIATSGLSSDLVPDEFERRWAEQIPDAFSARPPGYRTIFESLRTWLCRPPGDRPSSRHW